MVVSSAGLCGWTPRPELTLGTREASPSCLRGQSKTEEVPSAGLCCTPILKPQEASV